MKWLALIISLAAIQPLSTWLRHNPRQVPKLWILVGFLPLGMGAFNSYMAIISWPSWPGYVKGFEFSLLDVLALTLYFTFPAAPKPRPLPFRMSMALYFVAVLLSALQAKIPEAALFYAWQLARMFLLYAVVARGCADPRVVPALLQGMAASIFLEAGITIWQRFGLAILQTPGTFDHQNELGLASHLVVFPFFALLLARQRSWLPGAASIAGILIEVLTTSRATVGLAGFGYALTFILSAWRWWMPRKAFLLFIGVTVAAIVAPLAVSSFDKRFAVTGSSEDSAYSGYDERAAFAKAADLMLEDHPWGVGANHYVLAANVDGYNTKAGVATQTGSERTNVHNIYWLVAAETGYFGLFTFVLLLLHPLIVALHCSLRNRKDQRGDLLIGLGIGLLIVYLHSFYEWVFVSIKFQYIFALDLGLVAGVAEQLGYWRGANPRPVGLAAGATQLRPNSETL